MLARFDHIYRSYSPYTTPPTTPQRPAGCFFQQFKNRMRLLSLALLLFSVCFPDRALAAVCNAMNGPKHDVQFIAGYSPASSTWIGTTEDRKFVLAGLTYSYRCWSLRQVDISYTTGVLPVAVLRQPAMPNFRSSTPRVVPAHSVYGVAVLPIGFTAHFGSSSVRPFFETH